MRIKTGHTRIVFIFKNSVIKIPRFNIIWKIRKLFTLIYFGQLIDTLRVIDRNLFKAILKSFFLGLYSNRLELSCLKKLANTSHLVFVEEKFIFFVKQKFVVVLSEEDPIFEKFKQYLRANDIYDAEVFKARNMGIEDNRIKFIDYGNPKIVAFLKDEKVIQLLNDFSINGM